MNPTMNFVVVCRKRLGRCSTLLLPALLVLPVVSCVSDDNLCGDDMDVLADTNFGSTKYCTPKPVEATDPGPGGVDTDTGSEVDPDAGRDTGPAGSCDDVPECPDGEYCDPGLDPPACRKPPTGEGTPCSTQEDCADFEASYCELYVSMTCLLQDCSPALNNCSPDYLCCDFAAMGLPSLCVLSETAGGVCP